MTIFNYGTKYNILVYNGVEIMNICMSKESFTQKNLSLKIIVYIVLKILDYKHEIQGFQSQIVLKIKK